MRVETGNGVELHVLVDEPDGPDARGEDRVPILLVHGLASNARLWDGVRETLAGGGWAVAAVDLRGHGLSGKPDTGYDFETIAADVVAVLDALGWDAPIVAGQSWGGNVVLELAARHPARVSGVMCVDGGWIELGRLGPWEVVRERLAPPNTTGRPAAEMERYMRAAHPTWSDTAIRGALACFEIRDDATVAPWLSRDRHLTILRHLWEHKPAEVFPKIDVPVVLVPVEQGHEGRGAEKHAAVARAEELLRSSRTVWFESSHDVHAERPAEIAALLEELAASVLSP